MDNNTARDIILQRVRQGLAKPSGSLAIAPASASTAPSYASAAPGQSLVDQFKAALEQVGGQACVVPDNNAATQRILDLVKQKEAKRAFLLNTPLLQELAIAQHLREAAVVVETLAELAANGERIDSAKLQDIEAKADISISGLYYAIAETGTMVLRAGPTMPRAGTMLAPVHVAIVQASQIVPHFEGLIPQLRSDCSGEDGRWSTSYVMLTTGPSRTADIEQTLTIGVHGPGEVYVVIIKDNQEKCDG